MWKALLDRALHLQQDLRRFTKLYDQIMLLVLLMNTATQVAMTFQGLAPGKDHCSRLENTQSCNHSNRFVFKSMRNYIDLNQWNNGFYFLINWLTVKRAFLQCMEACLCHRHTKLFFFICTFFLRMLRNKLSITRKKGLNFEIKRCSYLFFKMQNSCH